MHPRPVSLPLYSLFFKELNCYLLSRSSDKKWVDNGEGPIGFQTQNLEGKTFVTLFYLTEMKEAKFGAMKEVLRITFGIKRNLVPWSASSTTDNKKLATNPEAFIGVTMSAKKYAGFTESNKRLSKVNLGFLIWAHCPTMGIGSFVAAGNDIVHLIVLLEFLKFN